MLYYDKIYQVEYTCISTVIDVSVDYLGPLVSHVYYCWSLLIHSTVI